MESLYCDASLSSVHLFFCGIGGSGSLFGCSNGSHLNNKERKKHLSDKLCSETHRSTCERTRKGLLELMDESFYKKTKQNNKKQKNIPVAVQHHGHKADVTGREMHDFK